MQNNKIIVPLFYFLAGCTVMEDVMTEKLTGQEVYVCHNENNLTIGKKIVQNITDSNEYGQNNVFKITMLDKKSGYQEMARWANTSPDYMSEIQQILVTRPFCTKAKYKQYLERQRKEKQEREEKERFKKEQEAAKRAEEIADCKQAIDKAQQRNNEIKNIAGNVVILDETITTSNQNKTSNWSYCLKVAGYDKEGIVVESRCTFSPVANLFLAAFVGCEEKRYFIYTQNDYADGECYKDWSYLHKDAGVHTWKGKRLRSYKKTNFQISEIEYETYLKDKTHQCQ
ncbi:MAG: hypothetical protein IJS26_01970 [Alphaproteobacteria bacterium]|nr:hypothetical protein [Alphaproteobacteria bacterium]